MILVATTQGLSRFDADGRFLGRDLEGRDVRGLAPESWERLWAAVDRRQIWRTEGDGWQRVIALDDLAGAEDLEINCLADTRANSLGGILAGTSRARLLRVTENHDVGFVEA